MIGQWIGRCRAPIRLLGLALAALLALATVAGAHASLNATSPVDGAVVPTAPRLFTLTFSEPVSPLALKIIRPDGASVGLSDVALRDRTLEIVSPSDLGNGTHILTWRVVSADGHPIAGSVVFSIGAPSALAPMQEEVADWSVRAGLWVSRVALYAGLFLGAGGAFARAILMPGSASGRKVVAAALLVGLAGSVAATGFQGLDALGAPVANFGDSIVWSAGFGTSFGASVAAGALAFAAGAIALVSTGRFARVAATASLLLAALAPALSGHASAASPQWLMRPAVFLHALAVAAWIGALAPMGLALHRREPQGARALRRFSAAIPFAVALLVLSGLVLALVQVGRPGALLDTAYGQVFLVKLALLCGLFLLAAVNRLWLTSEVERADGSARRRLVKSIAAETLLALAIFGAVAAWRFTPPPRALDAAASEPARIHIHTASAMADLAVSPGRAGTVDVSAVVMTGDFGPLDAREVTFVFSNNEAGIEPFSRKAEKPGDGTWVARGVLLPLPGEWTVRMDILVTDFELARIEGVVVLSR